MPGIFIQNAIFGSTTTAIGLAEDLKKGLIDRFRSLPMARSAVLVGRTTSDLVKNFLLVVVVIGRDRLPRRVPVRGGVRSPPSGSSCWSWPSSFTFSWISATIGLAIKQVEARAGGDASR